MSRLKRPKGVRGMDRRSARSGICQLSAGLRALERIMSYPAERRGEKDSDRPFGRWCTRRRWRVVHFAGAPRIVFNYSLGWLKREADALVSPIFIFRSNALTRAAI